MNIISDRTKSSSRYSSYFSFIQLRWAKFSEPHVCSLIEALKETRILKEIVDSGVLIDFRRWLKKLIMINEKHPYTKLLFKSITEIRREEVKHLLNQRYMIHPFSMFCLHYEFIMTLSTIFYLGYILPADIHHLAFYENIKWIKFTLDMIMTISIFIDLHTGYFDEENMCVHMKQSTVALHYLKTYLIWDILSCIPSYLIFFMAPDSRFPYLKLIKWLSLFRMVRIITIDRALGVFRECWDIPMELHIAIQIILKAYFVILCCMALMAFLRHYLFLYDNLSENLQHEITKEIMFDTIRSMMGVGKLTIAHTYIEAITTLVITAGSLILRLWIMAKLYIVWQRLLVLSDVGEDHYQQLAGYLKYKGLPLHIRREIYCYYEFKFRMKFYDESTIVNMLTDNLKKELPSYKLGRSVERIRFIRLLPHSVVISVVTNMENVYWCPGDVIFRVNEPSRCLYYIKDGTVALHDEHGVEVCHLEDLSYYGDIAVNLKQTHVVTMTAISPCNIYLLKHNVLKQILEVVPEIKERVQELSRRLLMIRRNDWVVSAVKAQRSITGLDSDTGSSLHALRTNLSLNYV